MNKTRVLRHICFVSRRAGADAYVDDFRRDRRTFRTVSWIVKIIHRTYVNQCRTVCLRLHAPGEKRHSDDSGVLFGGCRRRQLFEQQGPRDEG